MEEEWNVYSPTLTYEVWCGSKCALNCYLLLISCRAIRAMPDFYIASAILYNTGAQHTNLDMLIMSAWCLNWVAACLGYAMILLLLWLEPEWGLKGRLSTYQGVQWMNGSGLAINMGVYEFSQAASDKGVAGYNIGGRGCGDDEGVRISTYWIRDYQQFYNVNQVGITIK